MHAIQRMFQKKITYEDVHPVLDTGEVVEQYPNNIPCPRRLLQGWRSSRPLHVVVAEDSDAGKAF